MIIGYTVYLTLTVTVRGIDTDSTKLAKIVDVLGDANPSSIYGLTYDTSDPNAGKSVARSNAWNDAVAKAKQYAQLSGRNLGNIIIIEEVSLSYSPYYYTTTPSSGDPESNLPPVNSGSGPILPIGTILISVNVIVTWSIC